MKSSNGSCATSADGTQPPGVVILSNGAAEVDVKSLSSSLSVASYRSTDSEPDLRYGCFGYKPKWMQGLNTIAGAVAFISLANGVHSLANGLLGVVLSTLEKQFDLSSSASSWIASGYEIGPVPVLIIISIFANKIHRPRSCAIGLVSVALGCILFFIPQFASPTYDPLSSGLGPEDSLCLLNGTHADPCRANSGESLSYFLPLFIVGRLLVGAGSTPILTLGLTFMDDCTTKERLPTYAGIFAALSIVGPAVAFICGGLTLALFVDFYSVDMSKIDISPGDQRWLGAWWLGYIITAGISLLNALPLFGFSYDLPGASEIRRNKISEAHTKEEPNSAQLLEKADLSSNSSSNCSTSCSKFCRLFKDVFGNPTWLCLSVFNAADNFLIAGFTAFGPKLLEVMFSLSASLAGGLFGVVLLPAGAGGTILGGLLVEKLKLSCSQVMKLQAVLSLLVTVACLAFLLTCNPVTFAGVSSSYNYSVSESGIQGDSGSDGSTFYNLTDWCNVDCSCEMVLYEPICSRVDNVQYYSPCHAGCMQMDKDDKEYFNCSCIRGYGSLGGPDGGGTEPDAVWGACSESICWEAIIFIILFFFAVLFIFVCMTLTMTATLRCVRSDLSSTAYSIQILAVKVLGTIPGPLFIGWAFDLSCMLWDEECGVEGACMSYDVPELSLTIFFICIALKGLASIVAILAVIVYKPPKISDVSSLSSASSDSVSRASEVVKPLYADLAHRYREGDTATSNKEKGQENKDPDVVHL